MRITPTGSKRHDLAATLVTAGEVVIENCVPEHVRTPILKLQRRAQGSRVSEPVVVAGPKRPMSVSINNAMPGLSNRPQPQMAVITASRSRVTAIRETIFEAGSAMPMN